VDHANEHLDNSLIIVEELERMIDFAVQNMKSVTDSGKLIDNHQVKISKLAELVSQVRAARELTGYASRLSGTGHPSSLQEKMAHAYSSEIALLVQEQRIYPNNIFGDTGNNFDFTSQSFLDCIKQGVDEPLLIDIGKEIIGMRGVNNIYLEDDSADGFRDLARRFAKEKIEPIAQDIHRNDSLVPDELILEMADKELFASSIPTEYGGSGSGDLAMIIMTEELSAASLAAGGSLLTRSEILTNSLVINPA